MTLEEEMNAKKAALMKKIAKQNEAFIAAQQKDWVSAETDQWHRPSKETYYKMYDWKCLRDLHINKQPKCPFCGEPATEVHHILKFWHQPTEQLRREVLLDEENLLSLCSKHHKYMHSCDRNLRFRPEQLEAIDNRRNYIVNKHQGALWETDNNRHPIYSKEYIEQYDKNNPNK